MNKIKGIIFDMDNTLLKSRIDFKAMKNETFHFLVSRGIVSQELDITNHTTSTIIEEAMKTHLMTEKLQSEMWEIPKRFEMDGMKDAELEAGVVEILEELKGGYQMAVVTNNSVLAAEIALKDHDILDFFDFVVGREQMKSLKPSPDGFEYILDRCSDIFAEEWISVGDSWIDGKASSAAGMRFISYQGDLEKMNRMGVHPYASINDIRELKGLV
ncbi:HAD-IA family hydrolase [Paenibacillus sp. VCA1]|uniref:HAD family hydrolase n=1 Tax=Paenibacillus sp. VCA1 TaxID=3039148 RepID=UPI002871F14D|nr:HAD-IA family hydrolase [Paenibacillus sp. VCA1]MDR9856460.1 HAD-IA family hydrolase [Paenibacillus sp. VCA1]